MIVTCDVVDFDDAFICRDERTMLVVESRGANGEAREMAHKERYIDGWKYLEVDYDNLRNFIYRIRRIKEEEERSLYFSNVDELLEYIRGLN